MSDAILKRLEAVAARLESYANKVGSDEKTSGSSSGPAAAAGASSAGSKAWANFVADHVQPFLNACGKFKELNQVAEWTQTIMNRIGSVLSAAPNAKKPSDSEFAKFMDPVIQINNKAGNPDNRSPYFNQLKSFAESIPAAFWVSSPLPRQNIVDALESADFYMIKVLKDGKSKNDENWSSFAVTLKSMLHELAKFVTAHYPTGIEWNPSGTSLAEAAGGNAAPAAAPGGPSGAAPPPPPPGGPLDPHRKDDAPKPAPTAGGLEGVMASIRGANVTAGLKKVDKSQMTHKNPALREQALQPKEKPKAEIAEKKTAASTAEKKEPKLYLNKGTWFVEHYEGGDVISIPEVQLKESVYIMKCKNVTISIPDKCKSIQVDNCMKINVVFKNIVSIFECFNSKRVSIECTEACPSVSIDKSEGCSITLSRDAIKQPPYIVTSSITELNLVVPGKTDEDDPIEIPLPEQYVTTFDPKTNTIKTECNSSLG